MNAVCRKSLSIRLSAAAAAAALTLIPLTSVAQQGPTNQTIQWSPALQPVVLGSGVLIAPNQIGVLNQGVDNTKFVWQNKTTTLSLLDYANVSSTMSQLHLNAWAEYNSFFSSGHFSFDYNTYEAYNGNTRTWEVDVHRTWTAKIPKPNLTPDAISYQGDESRFQGLYGNYAVTAIAYRRDIRITFQQTFQSSVSSTQWNAAISGSYGCFSGGVSASQAQANLSSIGQTSITVEVDGVDGSQIVAAGSSGDLANLQAVVQNQLGQWDNAPTAPNAAGTVDTVYLTTYNAVTPLVPIPTQPSPNQIVLTGALTKLVTLLQAQNRLSAIASDDKNLNPKLYAYLFGSTDANGNHVPGKFDVVNADVILQTAYYKSLAHNDGLVSNPNITFSFDDPDAIKWRVLDARMGPSPGQTGNWGILFVEIYSNAQVDPQNITALDATNYGTRWFASSKTTMSSGGIVEIINGGGEVSEEDSYSAHLDPVTGIPHRFAYIEWTNPATPCDVTLNLFQNRVAIYSALDWDGNPLPTLLVSGLTFHLP